MDDKENNKLINKKVFENIIIAVILMIYFIGINYLYNYNVLDENKINLVLKVASMVMMSIGIVIFEIAYRKDSGKLAINGIEAIVIAAHTLSVSYVVQVSDLYFDNYILISSYIVSIYYVMKSIFVYTREKKKYLNSLSDIREIVNDKPQKKEATKKKK